MADRSARKMRKRAAQLEQMEARNEQEAQFFWQCVGRGGGGQESRLSAQALFGTQVRTPIVRSGSSASRSSLRGAGAPSGLGGGFSPEV
jgi:hypothetical protein